MRELERAVERLRPLVQTKAWDYCVLWKLGDDPSRFIEWMDCCCGGGYGHINVKEERGGEQQQQHLLPLCRDVHFQHPIRTEACEALAHFPSSLPLYSGIHGEVVISTQSKWLNHANVSHSNPSHESFGTRVLIPVIGGLIELFAPKHMPKDQKIIEFVMAQCNVSLEQEAKTVQRYTNASLNDHTHNPSLVEYLHNWPPPFHHLSCIPILQSHPPITQPSTYPSFKGSSTTSDLSNENPSFDSCPDNLSPHASLNQSIGKSLGSGKRKYCENLSKQHMGLVLGCSNHVVQIDNVKVIQKPEKERYQSKNLVLERNRRNRIKDGLYALRALVPKISKMDRISILGDAFEYIEELNKTVKELQDELKEREEEECNKINSAESKISKSNGVHGCSKYPPTAKHNQGSSNVSEKKQMEVQVEVKQIGTREFLLKFFCEQKQGGFTRLLEAMNSLGVLVIDANVTTFNGNVLNILKAEANKEVQPKKLRDLLIKLTG